MKNKNVYLIIILILFLVGFVFPPFARPVRSVSKKIIYTPARAIYGWFSSVGHFLSLIGTIGNIAHENTELKANNLELQSSLVKMNEITHENDVLREALKFSESSRDKKMITGKVIAHSPVNTLKTLVLSAGKKDGVQVGQTVIYNGYLVGRVSDVVDSTSTVFLITNVNSLVPALLQGSRAQGLLRGGISGLVVEKIPFDVAIGENEDILTSGLGDVFVKDIPIGKVAQVISKESEIFKEVSVSSPVEFDKLEVVFVIQ